MKNTIYFLLFILINTISYSQNQFSEKIISDCEKMSVAMKNKDYETILNFTYPKIIEMSGGRNTLLSKIKSTYSKMENEGFVYDDEIIGKPQEIFKAGKELHCIVPKETIMKTPKGRIKATYYLLAISKDNGINWFFIETHQLNNEYIKLILPNFNHSLSIPQKTKPVLIN